MIQINDDSRERITLLVKLNLRSILCDYSDAYILVKGTIKIVPVPSPSGNPGNNDKEGVFN